MRMVRKQVYISQAQDEKLKQLASDLAVTEAEILRRAIDLIAIRIEAVSNYAASTRAPELREVAEMAYRTENLAWSRADLYRGHARALDRKAWEEELAFIEERAREVAEGGESVNWRREDSHDQRRSRLSD
jgi:hypothetical protein